MVDAEAQTEAPCPAAVVGVEQDLLFGVRVRKSFGARAFWGSVVGCYWVSGGLFYKVSFDDGDVDLFSADEVLRDAQEAKKHAKENPQASNGARNEPLDAYFNAMRLHSLKRKRDDVVDCSVPNVRRVQLWGQRLYASIYTNERNETFIKEMLKTEDGGQGEMESTGHVQVGDMILAVNHTRVLGLPSRDLAEMIKKPKRPITLTFYRPHQTRGEAEQATTPAAQTQQPPAPATVTPSSFLVPPPAFGNSTSAPPPPLPQWSQPLRAAMSEKEALQRSLLQSVAGRQGGYVPMGVAGPGNPVPNPGLMAHTQQYFQRFVDAAAMRASAGFSIAPPQHVRSMAMPAPQTSAPASRVEYYTGRNQRQRTTGSTLYHQVQQLQAQRNSTSGSNTISSSEPRTAPRTNSAPIANARTSDEPERRTASSEPTRNQPDASPNDESSNERNPAEITSRESARAQTSASTSSIAPAATAGTNTMTDRDVEAIAALAERDPMAAQRVWNGSSSFLSPSDTSATKNPKSPTTQSTSFLTPDGASSFLSPSDTSLTKTSEASSTSFLTPNSASADKSPTTVEHAAESASHSMSFLSPTDFNMEQTSMTTRQDLAATPSGQINSNVSVATVQVSRRRLYLTLGVQGTLIAVTSFVPDEVGRPGEVELSGKVLPGDVLVRVNATHIISGMTPSNVAEIVNAAPRPVTLWFERASWDILDGKA
ncbi:hypothetical protein PF005_g3466 [Phytophthora fragariae]|uniref:PDZ domain-containing protein n=1 Tax=Phytophthora fragariae TaxID=53985 RepID=A0A6A4EGT6_9STRA|nr:hypothetical protein PF003_g4020 [Phytophthora fragariae]KAE8946553.1 hypothetical protein PF009_g3813 [Phytophthora fragariae]KAE9132747.1 hypothetical protein PF010_g3080 [Phytophthora fragariae]KAE9133301.1 hypothetical protein PF007_g3400 [Phytophthora fragariae]KAE9151567.1 hypothetical protein PF006_g4140 [Phytophthora fragariae]